MFRDWKILVDDILESIHKIKLYTFGLSFDEFNLDSKTIDAVVRNFEIFGKPAIKYLMKLNQSLTTSNGIKSLGYGTG